MKKNKKWNNKLKRYEYLATADEVAQVRAKYDADQAAALADPRPTTVSLLHFIDRDMKAQVAAGACIVTMADPICGDARPAIVIVDVQPSQNARKCYDIIAADGKAWTRMSTILNIEWYTNQAIEADTIANENRGHKMTSKYVSHPITITCPDCETLDAVLAEMKARRDYVRNPATGLYDAPENYMPYATIAFSYSPPQVTVWWGEWINVDAPVIQCTSCQTSLKGGVDTFGSIDAPMCWNCHSTLMFDAPNEPLQITASIFAADAEPPKGQVEPLTADGPVWVNGSEVEPVIDSFTCDHCGEITETWCGKCYCCPTHCTCGNTPDGNTPQPSPSQPPSGEGGNGISMTWLKPDGRLRCASSQSFLVLPDAGIRLCVRCRLCHFH